MVDRERDDCSTLASFADHGIDDGKSLVEETYSRLRVADGDRVQPTDAFFDRLESAFLWAYLRTVDERTVPDDVLLAVEDARYVVRARFATRIDVDLRTEVVPAFYDAVASYHCAYRD